MLVKNLLLIAIKVFVRKVFNFVFVIVEVLLVIVCVVFASVNKIIINRFFLISCFEGYLRGNYSSSCDYVVFFGLVIIFFSYFVFTIIKMNFIFSRD